MSWRPLVLALPLLVACPGPRTPAPAPAESRTSTSLPDGSTLQCPAATRLVGDGDLTRSTGAFCVNATERRHGPFATWFASGKPMARGDYADGDPHGPWTTWYEDGSVQAEGTYDHGIRVGRWVHYYPEGVVQWEGDRQGAEATVRTGFLHASEDIGFGAWELIYYLKDGKADGPFRSTVLAHTTTGAVVGGVPDGDFVTVLGDELRATGRYDHGFATGTWIAYEAGRPHAEVTFEAGVPVTIREWWAGTDKLYLEGSLVAGAPEGTWRYHDEQGRITHEQIYAGGVPDGTWTTRGVSETRTGTYDRGVLVAGTLQPLPPRSEGGKGFNTLHSVVPAGVDHVIVGTEDGAYPELCADGASPLCAYVALASNPAAYMKLSVYLAGGAGDRIFGFRLAWRLEDPAEEAARGEMARLLCVNRHVADACGYAARAVLERADGDPHVAAGLALLGCEADPDLGREACSIVLDLLARKQVVSKVLTARGYAVDACGRGAAIACEYEADALLAGKRPKEKAAAALLTTACDGGIERACVTLADLYRRGAGVARDAARADQLMEQACRMSSEVSWPASRDACIAIGEAPP